MHRRKVQQQASKSHLLELEAGRLVLLANEVDDDVGLRDCLPDERVVSCTEVWERHHLKDMGGSELFYIVGRVPH